MQPFYSLRNADIMDDELLDRQEHYAGLSVDLT
jgi:hypothetical protein